MALFNVGNFDKHVDLSYLKSTHFNRELLMDVHGNQATTKYLGYVYQVLIAIQQCFNAQQNQTIWIECYGDVYDGHTGTEVKHHTDKDFLIGTSVDFWKTLKNWLVEDTDEFQEYVLHTTSEIKKDSVFYGWDDLSKTNRYNKLKGITPTETIKDHYNKVFSYKALQIKSILQKVTIKSSQPRVEELWEELTNHRMITGFVKEEYKEDALKWIYGYVNKLAIKDHRCWNIKVNDFDRAKRVALCNYAQDILLFQSTSKTEIDAGDNDFYFVQEMSEIDMHDDNVNRAVSDFLRAGKSQLKMINLEPGTMPPILDEYDETVLEEIEILKESYTFQLQKEGNNKKNRLSKSQNLYFNVIGDYPLPEIPSADKTPGYYQRGRVHYSVEQKSFSWKFKKSGES